MRSLTLPAFSARHTFELCVGTVKDPAKRIRLLAAAPAIESAEAEYLARGASASLFKIPRSTTVAGTVTRKEMVRLYNGVLSRRRSKARHIYDQLRTVSRSGTCPLCAQRIVSTLDHYLPKATHPALAVTPVNLVPACQDCNKAKLATQPSTASAQTLHPYFDNVDNEQWLFAEVVRDSPPALTFHPRPPAVWPRIKSDRVITHFRTFALGLLYASHAAVELANIRYAAAMVAKRTGASGLRAHLEEQADSCLTVARNSWQHAMYRALSESDWFCNEGFEWSS